MKEKFDFVGNLWDSLSPRERLVRFHLSISPVIQKSWTDMSTTENKMLMDLASRMRMDSISIPEPTSFSAPKQAKVETHH